nr:MAG TPA: hypothetical protein [Caudoviricetes sp.]
MFKRLSRISDNYYQIGNYLKFTLVEVSDTPSKSNFLQDKCTVNINL